MTPPRSGCCDQAASSSAMETLGSAAVIGRLIFLAWRRTLRRQASRSAHHHNCLAIDGAEPADFYGAFRCGRRPRVGVGQFVGGESGILLRGHHDGYAHLKGKPVVVRRIDATAEGISIHDRIDGKVWHPATSRLLLHPDCRVELVISRVEVGGESNSGTRAIVAEDIHGFEPARDFIAVLDVDRHSAAPSLRVARGCIITV